MVAHPLGPGDHRRYGLDIMRIVRLACVLAVLLANGCSSGVPVSQVSEIQLKEASDIQRDGMEALNLYGTDRTVYVAMNTLLGNDGISRVELTYDAEGNDAIMLHFTADGSNEVSGFTKSHTGTMIAIVIDGNLMLALPVRSEISGSAKISGGMSKTEVLRLYTMLTATEIKVGEKP
jgi:preprotein translocase subunit SecD